MNQNDTLAHQLMDTLQSLRDAGVTELPRAQPRPGLVATTTDTTSTGATGPDMPAPSAPGDVKTGADAEHSQQRTPSPSVSQDDDQRKRQLAVLQQEVQGCQCCAELVATRSQTVFGVGNRRPRLCFFGEAPGADEDRLGEPFVGKAGQLLNKIIVAMTLKREDVYILNVLKCRPPGNRTPQPDEVASCRHFFERQLEILQPEFICCLGGVAAQALLQTKESVGRLRGRMHRYAESKVVVTYHPAYLLRTPDAKRATWDDMQMLMREMGIVIPERR